MKIIKRWYSLYHKSDCFSSMQCITSHQNAFRSLLLAVSRRRELGVALDRAVSFNAMALWSTRKLCNLISIWAQPRYIVLLSFWNRQDTWISRGSSDDECRFCHAQVSASMAGGPGLPGIIRGMHHVNKRCNSSNSVNSPAEPQLQVIMGNHLLLFSWAVKAFSYIEVHCFHHQCRSIFRETWE